MKIIMPLFGFFYTDNVPFLFSYPGLSLDRLEGKDIPSLDGFSKIDIQQIKLEQWALIYQVEDNDYKDDYKEYVNLLLLAFRLFSQPHPPFIKFSICEEEAKCSARISMTMQPHNYRTGKSRDPFDQIQLKEVNEGFKHLQEMKKISARAKNALYFLFEAYRAEKFGVSFVMMMIVLESLFSKDEPPYNETKKTICQRASTLLNSSDKCTKQDIEKLYDLRCDIVHGRIDFNDQQRNNLDELAHLEYVITQCFRKLTADENYKKLSKEERINYMSTLDTKKQP